MIPLLLAALLILGNGFFVAAEFALVRVRSTQLDMRVQEGHRAAPVARALLDHLDAYLSATQLGITLTSLALGWIGEPAVAHLLEPLFQAFEVREDLIHPMSVAIGFVIISYLHIVVGEVAPKSVAISLPVGTSLAIAYPMRLFYAVFSPALVVLNASSNLLLKMFGIEPAGTHSLAVTGEELRQIAEQSAQGGQISGAQGTLLSNVFTFSDRVAHEIMVPRNKVHGIDVRRPVQESLTFALEQGHSRYPLYEGHLDELVGVLHIKDLLARLAHGEPVPDLRALARPPLFVPEGVSAQRLVRTFQREHTHLAVVLDEYGGVSGITTLEDALEELVGEIQDEYDVERPEVEEIAGGWSVEGGMLLDELEEFLELPDVDTEAVTLSGYIMEVLERIPRVGDEVRLGRWIARVTLVDRRTAERVEITPAPDAEPTEEESPADAAD